MSGSGLALAWLWSGVVRVSARGDYRRKRKRSGSRKRGYNDGGGGGGQAAVGRVATTDFRDLPDV